MSVVGSDYDELKQYNLAEIHSPTPKSEAKTSNGTARKVDNKDDNPSSNVAMDEPEPKDDVIPTVKSEDQKTNLDAKKVADDAHLTAS